MLVGPESETAGASAGILRQADRFGFQRKRPTGFLDAEGTGLDSHIIELVLSQTR